MATSQSRPIQDSNNDEPPFKRTRSLRSCLACRKARQKCILPNLTVEPSSSIALPLHLSCTRCRSLDQSCFVVDVAPISKLKDPVNSRRTSTRSKRERQSSTIEISPQSDDLNKSRSLSSVPYQHPNHVDNLSESTRAISPPYNDVRLFEPDSSPEHDRMQSASIIQEGHNQDSSSPGQTKARDWLKTARLLSHPFELLGHLLARQPNLQQNGTYEHSAGNHLKETLTLMKDLPLRYESQRKIMPFIPTFDDALQDADKSELFLGIMAYSSCQGYPDEELQTKLRPILQQKCFSCLLQSPRNHYDLISLLMVALHCPLLLTTFIGGVTGSISGEGLLSSVASAARSLGYEQCLSNVQITEATLESRVVTRSVQETCLWISLSLYLNINSLAGDVERLQLVKYSEIDMATLQMYCNLVEMSPTTSPQAKQGSALILLLLFRVAAANRVKEMCQNYVCLLGQRRAEDSRSVTLSTLFSLVEKAKNELQSYCNELREPMLQLATRLAKQGFAKDHSMDILRLDVAILQFLYFSRLVQTILDQTIQLLGSNISPNEFMKQLTSDPDLLRLFVSSGHDRAEVGKHILSLFLSTVRYEAKWNETQSLPWLNLIKSIPPLHLCSIILMAGQSITEVVDGSFKAGHSPYNRMGDSTLEMGELLLDGTSKGLRILGTDDTVSPAINSQANLFVLTAKFIDSLKQRLTMWKTASNYPSTRTNQQVETSSYTDVHNLSQASIYSFDDFPFTTFEDLFQDVLHTPIALQ